MEATFETLAIYMKPVGVEAFSRALYRVSSLLDELCDLIRRRALRTIIADKEVTAPGSLNGWTLPDALWLAACKSAPEINCYPMGEIAERSFKRTIVWLALYSAQDKPCNMDAELAAIQKKLRSAIKHQKRQGIQAYFLGEYFFEVCMDSERRLKAGAEADPCYRYHYPDGENPRSLAAEREARGILLEHCRKMSDDCLPALLQSLDQGEPASLNGELSNIYLRYFGKLPGKPKGRVSRKPPLNLVVGSKSWAELRREFTLDPNKKRLLLHTKKANVSFDAAKVEDLLAKILGKTTFRLHSLSRDLLDVGVVVYIADLAVKRERNLRRRLDILMPVRHPAIWNNVKELLAETVSFLGRDEVHFYFTKKKERAKPVRFEVAAGDRCVSLFSGGLDSAAGALQLLQDGWKPVLISQHANSYSSGVQKRLVEELNEKAGQPVDWLSLYVNRSHSKNASYRIKSLPKSPMTQFLRSFLFLSIAAVVAVEAQIEKVFVFENGPVALNPMISEARLNTRTAHPRFIASFNHLVEALFKVKLQIDNPFLNVTKGEVACLFAAQDSREMVKKTNSCWNAFAVPIRAQRMGRNGYTYRDDGDCLPCVIRRAAVRRAGLLDMDTRYLVDVFREYLSLKVDTRVMIADYLRFCVNLGHLQAAELLLEHPDFSVYAPDVDPARLISMYRRHAQELVECFNELGSQKTVRLLIPPVDD